jgi:hypothetical protein
MKKYFVITILVGLALNSFAQILGPSDIKEFTHSNYSTISSTLNSNGFSLDTKSSGYRSFKKSEWDAVKGYFYYLFIKDNSEGIVICFDQNKSEVIKIIYKISRNNSFNNRFYSYFSNYAKDKNMDNNSIFYIKTETSFGPPSWSIYNKIDALTWFILTNDNYSGNYEW